MFRSSIKALPILAISATAWAQFDNVDQAWERSLEHPTLHGVHPIEVEAAPDGGVLTVALARSLPLDNFQQPAEVVITRLDENGDVMWSDGIDSPPILITNPTGGRYGDAAIDAQGNAFVVVSQQDTSLLRRYGPNGAIVWQTDLAVGTVPGTSGWYGYRAAFVEIAPSGDIIVGGLTMQGAYPRADVRTFASNGALRWEWRGDGGTNSSSTAQAYPRGMAVGPDGRVYVLAQSDGPFNQHSAQVTALDSTGGFLWRRPLPLGDASVAAVDFDSQGQVVAVMSYWPGFTIAKLDANGSTLFSTFHSETGYRMDGVCIAIDAFDRIAVGGWRRSDAFGARDATLFRFAPDGAFLGFTVPSVVGPAQDGSFLELTVTPRNDVVAFGFSRTGFDEVVLARFAPDGTERWSERRRGHPAQASGSTSVGLGLAVDPRGNLLTLVQTIEGGVYPNQSLGLIVAKEVQNGPAGSSYCGPALINSTGAPATLRALGPSLRSADNVNLRADDLPPDALTLFLASRTQGNVPNVGGGQGRLCLGGAIGRFFGPGQVRVATGGGSAALQIRLGQLPQPTGSVSASAGESWSFQGWYRDANPGPTSNLTDGVEVILR